MYKALRRHRIAMTVLSLLLLSGCMHVRESDARITCAGKGTATEWNPGNYLLLYTGASPNVVRRAAREIAKQPEILGLQIRYKWKHLEPARGKYDFSQIQQDLETLTAFDKRLVVQLQFKSFTGGSAHYLPDYIAAPEFGGMFTTDTGKDVAYWNPGVRERLDSLATAMSEAIGDYAGLEAITLGETALSVRNPVFKAKYYAPYLEGLIDFSLAVKRHFPEKVVIQYINWPDNDLLESAVDRLVEHGVGVGGPDVFTHNKKLEQGAYRMIRSVASQVPVGVAVQYENYHATTHRGAFNPPGIDVLDDYARNHLNTDYIFWLRRTAEKRKHGVEKKLDFYNDLLTYFAGSEYQANPLTKRKYACSGKTTEQPGSD